MVVYNITTKCNHPDLLDLSSYRDLMIIPNLLDNICISILSISFIEFLASQSPYSMRINGQCKLQECVRIHFIIGYGIYWPFIQHFSSGTEIISCEFWYLLDLFQSLSVEYFLLLEGDTRTKREKMCYQMNISLQTDTIHKKVDHVND